MDLCYICCWNAITSTALKNAEVLLDRFHELRRFFVDIGVHTSTSLPHQHALLHYLTSIPMFGSPNGLCSSITESKHIKAVKEPWQQSSCFQALAQMLRIIVRLDKLAALRQRFLHQGMLVGSTAGYVAQSFCEADDLDDGNSDLMDADANGEQGPSTENRDAGKERLHDAGPVDGPQALSSIVLARHLVWF